MKILVIGINYAPEIVGIAKYTTEFVEWLVKNNHLVTVITGQPHYPAMKIHQGFKNKWQKYKLNEPMNNNTYNIWRCPIYIGRKRGAINRILNTLSFFFSSFFPIISSYKFKPDIIFVVSPSIINVVSAYILSKLIKKPVWLHTQDFEINAAFDLKILNGNMIFKALLEFEKNLFLLSTINSTISENMVSILKRKINNNKTVLFRNWINLDEIRNFNYSDNDKILFMRNMGIPLGRTVLLYSGSMGKKQGLELLSNLANSMKNENVFFIYCGDGPLKEKLVEDCKGLTNVMFLPLQEYHKYLELIFTADIHLLPQSIGVADSVLPSKLMVMMASGSPVVATATSGTEVSNILSNKGLVCDPGSAIEFRHKVLELVYSPDFRKHLGREAREYAFKHFDRDKILGNVIREMGELSS